MKLYGKFSMSLMVHFALGSLPTSKFLFIIYKK